MTLLLFFLCYHKVFSKELEKIETDCINALVKPGLDCDHSNVTFDFSQCKDPLLSLRKTRRAKSIQCKEHELIAVFENHRMKIQAVFTPQDDGWETAWKLSSFPTAWRKSNLIATQEKASRKPAAISHPTKKKPFPINDKPLSEEKESAPVQKASETPLQEVPSSPFKFGLFADGRFFYAYSRNSPLTTDARTASGFMIGDGALYFKYQYQNVSFIADLPFRSNKNKDYEPNSNNLNTSDSSAVVFGFDKAQLYIQYNPIPYFILTLGQFDAIFGVELNDSKDRIFEQIGLVFNYTLPFTHTGFMAEFFLNSFYLKGLVDNPNNKASWGSTIGDNSIEIAGAVGFMNSAFRTQLGAFARKVKPLISNTSSTRWSLDFMVGTTLGAFNFDFEYTHTLDPMKNTLTPNNPYDIEQAGNAFLALTSIRPFDPWLIGLRFEYMNHDPSASYFKQAYSYGITNHYRLQKELELRAEYVLYEFRSYIGGISLDHRITIATIFNFS